jgi:hypothetical protein
MREENQSLIIGEEVETLEKLENIPLLDDEDLLSLGEIFDEDEQ